MSSPTSSPSEGAATSVDAEKMLAEFAEQARRGWVPAGIPFNIFETDAAKALLAALRSSPTVGPTRDALDAAISEMERAYPEDIFTPLSDADIKKLVKAMGHNTDINAPSDRLHSQWARHLTAVIRRRAKEIADADNEDALLTPPTVGPTYSREDLEAVAREAANTAFAYMVSAPGPHTRRMQQDILDQSAVAAVTRYLERADR